MGEPSDKRPAIDEEECTGCGLCIDVCEQGVLELGDDDICKIIDLEKCTGCGDCAEECPTEAISME